MHTHTGKRCKGEAHSGCVHSNDRGFILEGRARVEGVQQTNRVELAQDSLERVHDQGRRHGHW